MIKPILVPLFCMCRLLVGLSNLTSSCGLLTAQSIKCEIGLRFAKYFAEFICDVSLRLVGLVEFAHL